ncbi:hypothetical protein MVES_000202 [Malassezia vespertilionis]|uniref:Uncharacterized protein n=1 Tax=Malassezia vespertilionis TaxID=2020962 RepID=A0A2N1JFZ1_9BASI|nr:hypothetical protein MVES_000202 [Malassezia vespertilionis]
MSGRYRARPSDSSSSPPVHQPDTLLSSPPSSPTYGRTFSSISHLSADPFSGSAKTLSSGTLPQFVPSSRRLGRAHTMPDGSMGDRGAGIESLTLVPVGETSSDLTRGTDVLGQFFSSSSEDDLSLSSDDAPRSMEHTPTLLPRTGHTRSFSRTESAGTDPLSALGPRSESTSPRKLTRAAHDTQLLPAWEQPQFTSKAPRIPPLAQQHARAEQWQRIVNNVFDQGKAAPALSLGGCHMGHIPSLIGDLNNYVVIAPRRTESKAHNPARESSASVLEAYFWDNALTRLPSALFQLSNLSVLSLRKNNLTCLPPAIGELRGLRELNIGGNTLRYLPAEIQRLALDTFTYVPNPFCPVPPNARLTQRARNGRAGARTEMSAPAAPRARLVRAHSERSPRGRADESSVPAMVRVLGPLERCAFPSLLHLCIQRLVSADPDGGMCGVLLDRYETGCLRALRHTLDVRLIVMLEAARRSVDKSWGTPTNAPQSDTLSRQLWYEDCTASHTSVSEAPGIDPLLEHADDAAENIYFNRCPDPQEKVPPGNTSDWPLSDAATMDAPLFVAPAEQRMEWVSHVAGIRVAKQGVELLTSVPDAYAAKNSGCLPLLWRGSSAGSLAFLER